MHTTFITRKFLWNLGTRKRTRYLNIYMHINIQEDTSSPTVQTNDMQLKSRETKLDKNGNTQERFLLFSQSSGENPRVVHPSRMAWGEAIIYKQGGRNQPSWFGWVNLTRRTRKIKPPTHHLNGKDEWTIELTIVSIDTLDTTLKNKEIAIQLSEKCQVESETNLKHHNCQAQVTSVRWLRKRRVKIRSKFHREKTTSQHIKFLQEKFLLFGK